MIFKSKLDQHYEINHHILFFLKKLEKNKGLTKKNIKY